jgi:hypothetical protein
MLLEPQKCSCSDLPVKFNGEVIPDSDAGETECDSDPVQTVELDEIDDSSVELLTNRRLVIYSGSSDRTLTPIYESVFESPFETMVTYSLLNILKINNCPAEKVISKTKKEYVFSRYDEIYAHFWLSVDIANNPTCKVLSWLICPDKTPLIISLLVTTMSPDGNIKPFNALITWDPTDSKPITTYIKETIRSLILPAHI